MHHAFETQIYAIQSHTLIYNWEFNLILDYRPVLSLGELANGNVKLSLGMPTEELNFWRWVYNFKTYKTQKEMIHHEWELAGKITGWLALWELESRKFWRFYKIYTFKWQQKIKSRYKTVRKKPTMKN